VIEFLFYKLITLWSWNNIN